METPIYRAAYRWTSEEAEMAVQRHIESQWNPKIIRGPRTAIVLAVLGLVAMAVLWERGIEKFDAYFFCASPLLIWLVILQNFRDAKKKAVALFKKDPSADLLSEWEISAQEAKHWCRGLYYAAESWKNFSNVVEASDGFLLYRHAGFCLWLPFRAFEMPEAPERVREIVQASGVPYKKISG